MGTENGILAAMQCYLRSESQDEYAATKAHKYVPSTRNQKIECFWLSFRKQRAGWWIDSFNDLHESDQLDLTCEIEQEALWFSFANVLQSYLDKFKEYHNSHTIRKSKHAAVSGIQEIMYYLPEEFGKVDCLKDVSPQKLNELKVRLDVATEISNTACQDYFQYVMTHNGLLNPSTIAEAGILFERLVQYAKLGNSE